MVLDPACLLLVQVPQTQPGAQLTTQPSSGVVIPQAKPVATSTFTATMGTVGALATATSAAVNYSVGAAATPTATATITPAVATAGVGAVPVASTAGAPPATK